MADPAHEAADRAVDEIMAEVRETYLEAQEDAQEALSTYLARFEEEDAAKLKLVEAGELSEGEYRSWRASRVLAGKRYASLLDQVAWGYEHANEVAMAALEGRLPEVYAENVNFEAYAVCESTGLAVPFDMASADAVQQMVANGADLFPVPSVNAAKDVAWNRKLMASQLTQGLLLGEPMPKIARRVQGVTDSNWATALRTARTAVTAAENAGRVESHRRAREMGIRLQSEWVSTLDGRTRHSHRAVDGERVGEGERFSNGCRFPGDPQAPYAETMNCRCTLVAAVEGVDASDAARWGRLPEGMTYGQWKAEGGREASPAKTERASINRAADVYRKLNDAELDALAKVFSSSDESPAHGMYRAFEDRMSLYTKKSKDGAYFQPAGRGKGVHIRLADDLFGVDSIKDAEGATWFHEFGHQIDFLAKRGKNSYFSASYKHGEFRRALVEDVENIMAEFDDEKDMAVFFKISYLEVERRGLSDIMHGATNGGISLGFGHSASYWSDPSNLPAEAFAHFTSAYISNPDALAVLKEHLPTASRVYDEMVEEIVRRTRND